MSEQLESIFHRDILSVILSGHQNLQVIRRVDVEPDRQLARFDTEIRELGHCLGENLVVAPGHILEHRGHWTIEPNQIVAAIAAWSQNYARLGTVKARLAAGRATAPLFDTQLCTRNIEGLFEEVLAQRGL